MSMKTVYIMSAISGSGKSTLAKTLFPNAIYLNADSIREELCGDASDQSKNREVFEILYKRLNHFCELGVEQIVVDNTSLTEQDRGKIIYYIDNQPNFTYNIVLISIKPNLEQALLWNSKRDRKVPDYVIEKQFNRFESPTDFESSVNATVAVRTAGKNAFPIFSVVWLISPFRMFIEPEAVSAESAARP